MKISIITVTLNIPISVKHRKPRTGRNPRTGISVEVNEKFVPFFKPGKLLRERLNK